VQAYKDRAFATPREIQPQTPQPEKQNRKPGPNFSLTGFPPQEIPFFSSPHNLPICKNVSAPDLKFFAFELYPGSFAYLGQRPPETADSPTTLQLAGTP